MYDVMNLIDNMIKRDVEALRVLEGEIQNLKKEESNLIERMTKEELIQQADDYDLFLKDLKAETKALQDKRKKEDKIVLYICYTTAITAVVFLFLSYIGGN